MNIDWSDFLGVVSHGCFNHPGVQTYKMFNGIPLCRECFDKREHRQTCLHEAAHAVVAIMSGIFVRLLAVFKGNGDITSPAYAEWFHRCVSAQYSDRPSMKEFEAVYHGRPAAFVIVGNKCSALKDLEQEIAESDDTGSTEILAQARAPAIIEPRTSWTDKTRIAEGLTGDNVIIKMILESHPEYKQRFHLLKGKTIWEAVLEHLLVFKHVSQSIELVGRKSEESESLDAETLLSLCLTETERVINLAHETDDFFIDSAKGCAVPFERVKAEVLEMVLGASSSLLSLLRNTPNKVTDMDLIMRNDKWLNEYNELIQNNGPTIYFNLPEQPKP
jgi:hypothetical protein